MFIVKTVEETKQLIKTHCRDYPLKTTVLKTDEALGAIASKAVKASIDVPHFNRSTVDGYAIIHSVAPHASPSTPLALKVVGAVEMGKGCPYTLDTKTAVYVPTGAAVPENATAVVMVENTDTLGDEVLINKKAAKWENILQRGTDMKALETVVEKNTRITPAAIGALQAVGVAELEVYQKLRALVLSTGDEVTDRYPPSVGEVLDINTHTLRGYLEEHGVEVVETKVIRDDFEAYREALRDGMKSYDIVFASGGSSVGEKDYTFQILENLDAEIFVHGVHIKPGKPTILAKLEGRLFVGLPGQPTSAFMVLNTLFPTIRQAIHQTGEIEAIPYLEGVMTHNVSSAQGRTTYQLVTLSYGNPVKVTPLFAKSGMIHALSRAYGYIIIPDGEEGLVQGDPVKVYRLGD
ncbi:MAG: molybdopterin molybdotransferase MoeA [Bacillota bacterium]